MRAYTNIHVIRRNARFGRWLSFVGMGALLAALIVSLQRPDWVLVMILGLIIGFFASSMGLYLAYRWVAPERADQVLTNALKGLSKDFVLYNYIFPPAHVLLCPLGILILRAQLQEGEIRYDGKRWRQKFSLSRALGFSGQEALGNPTRLAQEEAEAMKRWLTKQHPEIPLPPIEPIIVFTRKRADVTLEADPPIPVIAPDKLKNYLRQRMKEEGPRLSAGERQHLEELFTAHVPPDMREET